MFFQFVKPFVAKCRSEQRDFALIPSLSSLWDVMSYSIYSVTSENNNHKEVLKKIFTACSPALDLPRGARINVGG